MPIEETLRRVDADLEHGRVLPAINRLRGLVHERPDRLDVRRRLAAVYRGQGELAQAGRWSFLCEELDPDELAAFERQFRTASGRLAAIAWTGGAEGLGPEAAERLAALRADAARESARRVRHPERPRREKVVETLGLTVAIVVALLALVGLWAVVVQGVRVVVGWF
jgi:hypothetical protein